MLKYVMSAFVCLAFAMPVSAQDCGCDVAPEPSCGCEVEMSCGCDAAPVCGCDAPRQRLGFVSVTRRLPQITRKCVTDCCGNSRRKFAIECVEVTGAKLGMVDRTPCKGGFLKGLFAKRDRGCGCDAAPSCGCEAPVDDCGCGEPVADCGCGGSMEAAPMYDSVPVQDAAPVYESAPMYESVVEPTAAPASDCGCNG